MEYTGNYMIDGDDGSHPFSPKYMGDDEYEEEPIICDLCGERIEDDSDIYLLRYNEKKQPKTVHKSCLQAEAEEDGISFEEVEQKWIDWYNKKDGTIKH